MEYHCHTSIGLIAIIPHPALPTSVELFVASQKCASYLSAEDAACAVASSTTGHFHLDSLPCWGVPALLSEWKQSLPHHFTADPSPANRSDNVKSPNKRPEPELQFAF